jgi:hypothetical protein
MKRLLCVVMLASLAGPGCEGLPHLWERPKPPPPAAPVAKPVKAVVDPEDVNDHNAHQKAQALLDELDREAQGQAPEAASKPTE